MKARVEVDKLANKLAKKEILTLCKKHAKKMAHTLATVALIFTLLARLTEVQVKTLGGTETSI